MHLAKLIQEALRAILPNSFLKNTISCCHKHALRVISTSKNFLFYDNNHWNRIVTEPARFRSCTVNKFAVVKWASRSRDCVSTKCVAQFSNHGIRQDWKPVLTMLLRKTKPYYCLCIGQRVQARHASARILCLSFQSHSGETATAKCLDSSPVSKKRFFALVVGSDHVLFRLPIKFGDRWSNANLSAKRRTLFHWVIAALTCWISI